LNIYFKLGLGELTGHWI